MGYLAAFGDGSDPGAIIFNSTKYPGTCKPSDAYTLGVFKELQRQLNRLAQGKGVSKIAVDGDVGPGTVALARTVGIDSSGSCSTIAMNAAVYASIAKGLADQLGVPASVSQPTPIKAPSIVNAAGQETTVTGGGGIAASVSGAFAGMSNLEKALALGIVGGIAYVVLVKKPKRKGR